MVRAYVATQKDLRYIDLWDAMLTAEGLPREFVETVLEFVAVFGWDFDAGRGDGPDFFGDVVGGAVGAEGGDDEEREEELAHGGIKTIGGV